MHFLIVWGTAASEIRSAAAPNEESAARSAFGTYDAKRMTFKSSSLSELRSTRRRTKLAFDLLAEHISKITAASLSSEEIERIVENATKQRENLKLIWAKEWAKIKATNTLPCDT